MSEATIRHFETNSAVSSALREAAALLSQQKANQFRALAYLKAADAIEELGEDISAIAVRGVADLEALPHIGPSLAAAIHEFVTTGKWTQLQRLRGNSNPEIVFQNVPGMGPVLAHVIHEHLHVDTLEALEVAAHDGRLAKVPGIGQRRLAIIRQSLAGMLARRRRGGPNQSEQPLPPVEILLDVDREYQEKSRRGELQLIAPKRFNPEAKAWLPVLHTERGKWQFSVFYSNTARAHDLGKTADWVVMFFSTDHQPEGQCTVVTETTGLLQGKRVVRGREKQCLEFWNEWSSSTPRTAIS